MASYKVLGRHFDHYDDARGFAEQKVTESSEGVDIMQKDHGLKSFLLETVTEDMIEAAFNPEDEDEDEDEDWRVEEGDRIRVTRKSFYQEFGHVPSYQETVKTVTSVRDADDFQSVKFLENKGRSFRNSTGGHLFSRHPTKLAYEIVEILDD